MIRRGRRARRPTSPICDDCCAGGGATRRRSNGSPPATGSTSGRGPARPQRIRGLSPPGAGSARGRSLGRGAGRGRRRRSCGAVTCSVVRSSRLAGWAPMRWRWPRRRAQSATSASARCSPAAIPVPHSPRSLRCVQLTRSVNEPPGCTWWPSTRGRPGGRGVGRLHRPPATDRRGTGPGPGR